MKIRPIKKSEIRQVSKIVELNYSKKYGKSSFDEITSAFSNKTCPPKYLVVEQNKNIIGVAGYGISWMDYGVYTMFWVNVTPEFQGKGIGTTLVGEVICKIKKSKYLGIPSKLILITSTKKNTYFYNKKFKFKKLCKIKNGDGEYLMGLTL